MNTRSLIALALPAALAVLPAAASAQQIAYETKAPVAVEAADIQYVSQDLSAGYSPLRLDIANGIAIRFVNRNSVAATDVKFSVKYNGLTEQIDDGGTFAPGTLIAHAYSLPSLPNIGDSLHVDVTTVRFADGSSWQAADRKGASVK